MMAGVRPVFVGIAGGSASGKTTLAKEIASRIENATNVRTPIISQDWYYKELADRSAGPTHNWDHPNSFDTDLIVHNINQWRADKGVWTPRHDYANYIQIPCVELIEPAPVMIFEGILAFADPKLRELLDVKVYVECGSDTALTRRVMRDVSERGYPLELVLERYRRDVRPAFEKWIEPTKKYADVIIYNDGANGLSEHRGVDIIAEYVGTRLISGTRM